MATTVTCSSSRNHDSTRTPHLHPRSRTGFVWGRVTPIQDQMLKPQIQKALKPKGTQSFHVLLELDIFNLFYFFIKFLCHPSHPDPHSLQSLKKDISSISSSGREIQLDIIRILMILHPMAMNDVTQ